jgi:hypothetical protein
LALAALARPLAVLEAMDRIPCLAPLLVPAAVKVEVRHLLFKPTDQAAAPAAAVNRLAEQAQTVVLEIRHQLTRLKEVMEEAGQVQPRMAVAVAVEQAQQVETHQQTPAAFLVVAEQELHPVFLALL